jgi:hypothetical protein
MRIITNVALEANAQWKVFADFQVKGQIITPFDIHMIKLLSTEDTLPVIAEKMQVCMNTFEIKRSCMKTRCLISRTIGSYLLRVANLNAKAMFLNIPKTKQAAILCIKIKRLTFQNIPKR